MQGFNEDTARDATRKIHGMDSKIKKTDEKLNDLREKIAENISGKVEKRSLQFQNLVECGNRIKIMR